MNDEEIKIEKGIPVPLDRRRWNGHGKWTDLLLRMDVGDSALIPYFKLSSVYVASKGLGYKVRCQAQDWPDHGDRQVRIWRVK